MTPIERLRLEKAGADCGFEMTATAYPWGLELRSARFPESVQVRLAEDGVFEVTASDPQILSPVAVQPLKVEGLGDLYVVLSAAAACARTRPDRVADEFRRRTRSMPRSTEAERLAVQRVGQGLFRAALLDYWQGKCCVTGLDLESLLRASHIRPWAHCESDEQRLDVFNGLLLAPQLDALFDAGLMTVEDDGFLSYASSISSSHRRNLGLPDDGRVAGLRPEHVVYLRFHRAEVWRG